MHTYIRLRILALLVVVAGVGALAQEHLRTKSFPIGTPASLKVDVGGFDVTITPSDVKEVTVTVKTSREEDLEEIIIEKNGSTVEVSQESDRGWWKFWRMHPGRRLIEIKTPRTTDMEIESAGGDITLMSEVEGIVDISTAGGDVRARDVEGSLPVSTAGGDIDVKNIGGDLRVSTSGGDVTVGSVNGSARVRTSGGDITLLRVEKSVDASSTGGDISIEYVGGDAEVSSTGGDIRLGEVKGRSKTNTVGGSVYRNK